MKFLIRLAVFVIPVLVVLAAGLPSDGLTVHEWGTFTSVAGEDGAAVDWDALGCKNDLPRFVNNYGYRGFKFRLQGTVRMETPVIYFYSSRELDAQVKVEFPQGLITEWYPRADYKVSQRNGAAAAANSFDPTMRDLSGGIAWKDIKVQPGTQPLLPVENDPSRYYAARGTDAAPLAVGGQHEKFLFYRGVGRSPVPLSARVSSDGKIVVENAGAEPVPSVILFENHDGRIGYRAIGAFTAARTLDAPSLDGSLPQLLQDLENTLIAQGLFPKEAHAMIETWRDSWFEEGSRLIYIVPVASVDGILPIEVTPTPVKIVRVFVGRIELVTADTKQSVELAVARSDWAALDRYDRFLAPILHRVYPRSRNKVSAIEEGLRKWQALGGGSTSSCGAPATQSATRQTASGVSQGGR